MLQMTIKEVITKYLKEENGIQKERYCIYLIKDEETVLYVGQAGNPYDRFISHIGEDWHADPSPIGKFILQHAPASGAWLFIQYTLEDCQPFVEQHYQTSYYDVDVAEEALIKIHRPHFNKAMNYNPRPLSKKYRQKPTENPYGEQVVNYYGIK